MAVNALCYCSTLNKFRIKIKNQRHGMISRGVIFLHDNVRRHMTDARNTLLKQCWNIRWESLEHSPFSADSYLVTIMSLVCSKKLRMDSDLQPIMSSKLLLAWFHSQPQSFFTQSIPHLVDHWDTCFNFQDRYVQTICSYLLFCILYFNSY